MAPAVSGACRRRALALRRPSDEPPEGAADEAAAVRGARVAVGSEKQGRRLGRGGARREGVGWGVWVGFSGAGRGGRGGALAPPATPVQTAPLKEFLMYLWLCWVSGCAWAFSGAVLRPLLWSTGPGRAAHGLSCSSRARHRGGPRPLHHRQSPDCLFILVLSPHGVPGWVLSKPHGILTVLGHRMFPFLRCRN